MATVNFSNTYTDVNQVLSYVAEAHKKIPDEDLPFVLEYITPEHVMLLYTKGYGCSSNPDLATEEFLFDREVYLKKKGHTRIYKKGKREILVHHIFVSLHKYDFVEKEELMLICDELVKRTSLKNFKILAAVHYNTDEPHIHLAVCAFSVDGTRKFCLKRERLLEVRREINYICYEHGLSIIENEQLLNSDEKYRAWFENVKEEGKVTIHPSLTNEERRKQREKRKAEKNKEKIPERSVNEEIKIISEYNFKNIRKEKIVFSMGNRYLSPRTNKAYYVNLWSETGRKRGTIELLFLLIATILSDTQNYAKERNYIHPNINIHEEAQKMIDLISLTRCYGLTSYSVLEKKLTECEGNIDSLEKAINELEKKLNNCEDSVLKEVCLRYKELLSRFMNCSRDLQFVKREVNRVSRQEYIDAIYSFEPQKGGMLGIDDLIKKAEREKKVRDSENKDISDVIVER